MNTSSRFSIGILLALGLIAFGMSACTGGIDPDQPVAEVLGLDELGEDADAPAEETEKPPTPNVCTGPAILETVVEGTPAVIKIDAGETWPFGEAGGCFSDQYFHGDQSFLDARYPEHSKEFQAKYAGQEVWVLMVEGEKLMPYESVVVNPTAAPAQPEASTNPTPAAPVNAPAISAGTVAWHQDTREEGHEASPVGQLGSNLWILAETWGPSGAYVVLNPPSNVAWMQTHYGGTGWWMPSGVDLMEEAKKHQQNIYARDGVEATIVVLPDQGFPELGCLQSKPIENGTRTCDEVGNKPSFTMQVGDPFPGYFQGSYTAPAAGSSAAQLPSVSTETVTATVQLSEFAGSLSCAGPGIVETTLDGVPVVIGVAEGETLSFAQGGSWCGNSYFGSQAALEARLPVHAAEFLAKFPGGRVFILNEDGQLIELVLPVTPNP